MARLTAALTGTWHRWGAGWAHHRIRWAHPAYTRPVTRWLVLQSGPNPSTDYYIRPRAAAAGVATTYRDIDDDVPTARDFADGTQVIVVRYLSRPWAEALRAHAGSMAGVVYFMDDDLLDPPSWHGLPGPYRDRLARHYTTMAGEIAALTSELWVSTPTLRSRYESLDARVREPLPLVTDAPRPLPAEAGVVRCFYHGSQAHDAEIRWLRPVVDACLEACSHLHFEIIGNHAVNKLYRDLPRTTVLHPMNWSNYVAHCNSTRGDIGLAPLLPTGFNAGRSHAKVFDITRCGAVGVYACMPPYDAIVRDGVDGALLPNEPEAWVRRIVDLATDVTLLRRLQRSAAQRHFARLSDAQSAHASNR
jgi:hypothetical protein